MRQHRVLCLLAACFWIFQLSGQSDKNIPLISELDLNSLAAGEIHYFWLKAGSDATNQPVRIPLMVAVGETPGPILGLTAAIHGNELNGIPIIQKLFGNLNLKQLRGTLIGVPGLNPLAISRKQRRFIDQEDLNRNFPGRPDGNRSEQMAFLILNTIIQSLDYHVDMHTASFGRINSLYARGDTADDTLATMLKLQEPDLILSSKGKPSFGTASGQTLRAAALSLGVKSITIEYGNPQVYQPELISRGVAGVRNLMVWLKMLPGPVPSVKEPMVCKKSYWIFTDRGGLLEVLPELNQKVSKGELIGQIRNSFGQILKNYYAPEDGVVIGKSTDPVNISGGRILHLGILE